MQKTNFSNQKIIILVIFLCSALMTSLFIYHKKQANIPIVLTNDAGTIFAVPREIKAFKLRATNNEAFTEKNFLNHWTLLFFGFTHCSNVCPATMDMLKTAYAKLRADYPNLQVVLVSLDPERDNLQTLAHYTHSFHQQFIGASGELQEIRKLQSQLGIFSARENTDSTYQLQHTSSILLINPKGQWAGIFKFGMNQQQFNQAFLESVKATGLG